MATSLIWVVASEPSRTDSVETSPSEQSSNHEIMRIVMMQHGFRRGALALLLLLPAFLSAQDPGASPGPDEKYYLNKPIAYWLRAMKSEDRWMRWRAVRALGAQSP